MNEKPLKYAAKQILFSEKIRKNNFNWIKKHPKKKTYNETDAVKIQSLKNSEDFRYYERDNEEKKNTMFKAKKIYKDRFPIHYDYNYIATGESSGKIMIFKNEKNEFKSFFEKKIHENSIFDIAWSHPKCESYLASVSYDKKVKI